MKTKILFATLASLLLRSAVAATTVGGTISSDTTWNLAGSPYVATSTVTVASNITLTIDPGVTVQFTNGTGMSIKGRLLAEGNPANRILFTKHPSGTSWTRLDFTTNQVESRIAYATIEYPTSSGTVQGAGTSLYLDNVIWTNTTAHLMHLTSCSLALLNSYLPSINGAELITAHVMPANGHALIQGNTFGSDGSGVNDIIDWTGGQRPGPILQVYSNVFLAGTDDGLDLDGTDAHIEGNIFMHFHASAITNADTSSAISGGQDSGNRSRITVARNLFYDCDHGILCKEGNFYVIQNNTFVNMQHAVVNFNEPLRSGVTPGAGVIFAGNIACNSPTNFENFTTNAVAVNYNVLAGSDLTNQGVGNIVSDPALAGTNGVNENTIRALFALLTNSPAIGAGPGGLDCGALVPAGATISGEPPGTTTNSSALLTIAGPGISSYEWKTNSGAWSTPVPLTNSFVYTTNLFASAVPIALSDLADGAYTVYVSGFNSAGVPQETVSISKTWIVQLDSDSDGMPDAWEVENGTNPSVNDANEDLDHDGLTNLQEYWVGTNPTDAGSVLRLGISLSPEADLFLSFDAVSNRTYTVESRDGLEAGNWSGIMEISAAVTNRTVEITNGVAGMNQQFYRVVAHPQ